MMVIFRHSFLIFKYLFLLNILKIQSHETRSREKS